MPKRTLFTNITPLPPQVSREVAIAMLHNHDEMIELNPLVIEHHPIKTPRDAPADEFLDCAWQELTDKIHYLPGGMVKGKVSYKACFHDTPNGLQTHIYAPMGLEIREKWTIGGSLPGEPPEPRELGVEVPRTGLYLREDGDMRCNMLLTSFVRKNLDNSHKVLVERILKKAERVEERVQTFAPMTPVPESARFQTGSHMSNSQFLSASNIQRPLSPQMLSPQQDMGWQTMALHPAFRPDEKRMSTYSLPPYQANGQMQQRMSYYAPVKQPDPPKQFLAELPGSTYHTGHLAPPGMATPPLDRRTSMMSELSGSEATLMGSPNMQAQSDRGSFAAETLNSQRLSGQDYSQDSAPSVASGVSGHRSFSDRTSMISELPSSQPAENRYYQTPRS
ncbi:hypothetical protein AYO21_03546 [Fonsecaea monophora]|uniref:Unplaced genomic scaffold supercont1.4, whole genome shotgun sequence n=2 Tax=Fonsecaea TaxID=40354 RepID=A0A0D2H743_9EURO|nr:uncharacterized protein Z517_07050 [Fonsecaea pedrosoi CBS 271.37]XP_022514044.1 hypothetical protein AYO21_03546 [Fonsecaea monophora]KAH0848094.1 hypothetical protein FOPE_01831 [Fonsecaea pedrosoi]KIW80434.1 hypothetical protein Z517_07050 [Fonsecaea pedrosoi CBS 271.37]OAG42092.1 hypothetical protein AYO21_03546 [Fonsecaea monophora]